MSRCDKVARSTGIKVVEVQGRQGPRLVEVASVLRPITLQTDGVMGLSPPDLKDYIQMETGAKKTV